MRTPKLPSIVNFPCSSDTCAGIGIRDRVGSACKAVKSGRIAIRALIGETLPPARLLTDAARTRRARRLPHAGFREPGRLRIGWQALIVPVRRADGSGWHSATDGGHLGLVALDAIRRLPTAAIHRTEKHGHPERPFSVPTRR